MKPPKHKYLLTFTCDTGKGSIEIITESLAKAEEIVKDSYRWHNDKILKEVK